MNYFIIKQCAENEYIACMDIYLGWWARINDRNLNSFATKFKTYDHAKSHLEKTNDSKDLELAKIMTSDEFDVLRVMCT